MPTKSTCEGCGLVFSSLAAFDAHRMGSFGDPLYQMSRSGHSSHVVGHAPSTRRCLTVPEIEALGLVRHDKGCWGMPTLTPEDASEEKEEATARDSASSIVPRHVFRL